MLVSLSVFVQTGKGYLLFGVGNYANSGIMKNTTRLQAILKRTYTDGERTSWVRYHFRVYNDIMFFRLNPVVRILSVGPPCEHKNPRNITPLIILKQPA